jgi:hypothetical protein
MQPAGVSEGDDLYAIALAALVAIVLIGYYVLMKGGGE